MKVLIEYDGRQHYIPITEWGGEKGLTDIKYRDAIKTRFAQDNGFILIRIPYTEKYIEWFLQNEIEKYIGRLLDDFKATKPDNKESKIVQPLQGWQLGLELVA